MLAHVLQATACTLAMAALAVYQYLTGCQDSTPQTAVSAASAGMNRLSDVGCQSAHLDCYRSPRLGLSSSAQGYRSESMLLVESQSKDSW